MILVDEPQRHQTAMRHKVWSHMASDVGADELHEMARRIGLKRSWSQEPPDASSHHYDVTPPYRAKAIALGAVAVTGRELVARSYDGLRARRALAAEIVARTGLAIDELPIVQGLSLDRNAGFQHPTLEEVLLVTMSNIAPAALRAAHPNLHAALMRARP